MKKVLIIGCGVVGGSIFKRLAKLNGYDLTIYDPFMSKDSMKHLAVYCRHFEIQLQQYNPVNYQKNLFDVAIIATPPQEDIYLQIAKDLQIFTLAKEVYEFSSVKGWLLNLEGYKDAENFTPVHIMAGSEKIGCENSLDTLHDDGKIILFTENNDLKDKASNFLRAVGNRKERIDVATKWGMRQHDKIVAWTSHFPQLFCFALNDIMHDMIDKEHHDRVDDALKHISLDWLNAEGLFRLCKSNRALWKSIFKHNSENLLNILKMQEMGYHFTSFKLNNTHGLEGSGYKMMWEYLETDKGRYLQEISESNAIKVAMQQILE